MIRTIALDDEPLALRIIENYCNKIDYIQLEKCFTKPSDAQKYIKKFPVDLIILDIQMPQKNGINFYKEIQQNTKVIFTTAFSNYAVDAFELDALDYILKPFSFERFLKATENIKDKTVNKHQAFLTLRADYKLHKINYDEILLIEALDDYVKVHLKIGDFITARQSLKNLETTLSKDYFIRIHRSYIIPISEIKYILGKNIKLGSFTIPIGDKYKNDILNISFLDSPTNL